MFQALLRNPLASPDTLGVSAGASLGAMMAITFDVDFSLLGVSAVPLASFAGSLGALAIVYGLSTAQAPRHVRRSCCCSAASRCTALLSAVIAFVQYLADFTETFRNVRWLMGSLDVASYAPIVAALVPMAVAWAGFATLPRVLDLISVGSESAAARGVERRADRADRARQRVAGDRRGGVAGRARCRSSASSCRTSCG